MSEPKMIGGPAFPMPDYEDASGDRVWGMSLRDWFAGQALAGMMANPEAWLDDDGVVRTGWMAFQCADAMLAARGAK